MRQVAARKTLLGGRVGQHTNAGDHGAASNGATKSKWDAVTKYVMNILSKKESDERLLQAAKLRQVL